VTQAATIAALRTPPGRGGIAVITLRGPRTDEILTTTFKPIGAESDVAPGTLQLGHLADNRTGETLDKVIVCRTDRGAEINIHGGPHVARRTMELLASLGAEPRAGVSAGADALPLAHDRWNNPAVGAELLAALPKARSTLAIAALSSQWSAGISQLAADADGQNTLPQPHDLLAAADGLKDINKLLDPVEIVLAGPPNAGKSTLANALVGREVSIVHETAGTTRDWVREPAVINGVPVWLTDTAGIWEAPEGIDSEAVRRARGRAHDADIVLLLEADSPSADIPDWLAPDAAHRNQKLIPIITKCDLTGPQPGKGDIPAAIRISAVTGEGLDTLKAAIVEAIGLTNFDPTAPRAFTTRQAGLLKQAADAIEAGRPRTACLKLDQLLRGTLMQRHCVRDQVTHPTTGTNGVCG